MNALHALTVVITLSAPWTAQAAERLSRDRATALETPSRNDRAESSLGKTNAEKMEQSNRSYGKSYRPWHEQPSLTMPRKDGKWHCGNVPTPGCGE